MLTADTEAQEGSGRPLLFTCPEAVAGILVEAGEEAEAEAGVAAGGVAEAGVAEAGVAEAGVVRLREPGSVAKTATGNPAVEEALEEEALTHQGALAEKEALGETGKVEVFTSPAVSSAFPAARLPTIAPPAVLAAAAEQAVQVMPAAIPAAAGQGLTAEQEATAKALEFMPLAAA